MQSSREPPSCRCEDEPLAGVSQHLADGPLALKPHNTLRSHDELIFDRTHRSMRGQMRILNQISFSSFHSLQFHIVFENCSCFQLSGCVFLVSGWTEDDWILPCHVPFRDSPNLLRVSHKYRFIHTIRDQTLSFDGRESRRRGMITYFASEAANAAKNHSRPPHAFSGDAHIPSSGQVQAFKKERTSFLDHRAG